VTDTALFAPEAILHNDLRRVPEMIQTSFQPLPQILYYAEAILFRQSSPFLAFAFTTSIGRVVRAIRLLVLPSQECRTFCPDPRKGAQPFFAYGVVRQ
jgi:hypothetical protein